MLPIVYTPTVGQAIERYSHEYRRPPGGLPVRRPPGGHRSVAASPTGLGPDEVDLIVATDAERILGIGDRARRLIPSGNWPVHADRGHPPERACRRARRGHYRQSLLDPAYLGRRHSRVTGAEYDRFIEAFVDAVSRPSRRAAALGGLRRGNARRLLDRYRDRLLTFNDDIQGTAPSPRGRDRRYPGGGHRLADQQI